MKDKLYSFFVRKNGRVWYEYERFVNENMDEHKKHRLKHFIVLMRLNWFYRVKKRNTPFLYPDVPLDPNEKDANPNENTTNTREIVAAKYLGDVIHFPEFQAEYREDIDAFVKRLSRYDIISFDIFDTLILRNVKNPVDVFHIIALRTGKADFLKVRVEAEKIARSLSSFGTGEVNVRDIYEQVKKNYSVDIEKAILLEEEVELSICQANPYMLEVFKRLIENKKKIIIVSDMYHSAKFLEKLLKKNGFEGYQKIFVSNEYGRGKYDDGALFKIAARDFSPFTRFVHVGDNKRSDIEMARKVGWDAVHYKRVSEIGKPYRRDDLPGMASSIYCGLANNVLHNGLFDKGIYYEFGWKYGGLLACGYCQWLNIIARTKKIDKFIFLARDCNYISQVYKRFYNEIANDYIPMSRYAVMQLVFSRYTDNYINFNIKRRAYETNTTVGTTINDLELGILSKYLCDMHINPQDKLDSSNVDDFISLIYSHKEEIEDSFSDNVSATKEFLEPLLSDCKNVCIVDLGWAGTNLLYMKDFIINDCGFNGNVYGCMMASSFARTTNIAFCDGTVNSYVFSAFHNRDVFKKHDFALDNMFVEILFSESCPSFLHFYHEDGEIKQLYASNNEDNNKLVGEIGAGIMDFAEMFNKIVGGLNIELIIEGATTYEPLLDIMKNYQYMDFMFGKYINSILPTASVDTTTIGQYMREKKYIEER